MKSTLVSAEIVEPYAEALMSVAKAHNLTQEFGDNLRALLDLLENSPELQDFLESPVVKPDDHKAILDRVMGDDTNSYLKNFLKLLVDKRRILFMPEVCEKYLDLLRKQTNTVLAEVSSATELNEQQKEAVKEKVKSMTDAQAVELKTKIDSDLIGGVVIKVGSQVLDASLRGQLRRMGLRLQ